MKKRKGFVSNSSSCSFIVDTRELSLEQIDALFEPKLYLLNKLEQTGVESEYLDCIECIDGWDNRSTTIDGVVEFWTYMDNFDYLGFVECELGIKVLAKDDWQ